MTHRFMIAVAATSLAVGAITGPAVAAAAAEVQDDDRGIVVGVEITPRHGCSAGCDAEPGRDSTSGAGAGLADSGADIAPALMIALALGASGLAVVSVARARAGRSGR
jgi:hypothetical protein